MVQVQPLDVWMAPQGPVRYLLEEVVAEVQKLELGQRFQDGPKFRHVVYVVVDEPHLLQTSAPSLGVEELGMDAMDRIVVQVQDPHCWHALERTRGYFGHVVFRQGQPREHGEVHEGRLADFDDAVSVQVQDGERWKVHDCVTDHASVEDGVPDEGNFLELGKADEGSGVDPLEGAVADVDEGESGQVAKETRFEASQALTAEDVELLQGGQVAEVSGGQFYEGRGVDLETMDE